MGQPAAKQFDLVTAVDMHVVAAMPKVLLPHPFNGILQESLSPNVNVMGLPAATVTSVANNIPPHIPPSPHVPPYLNDPLPNRGIVIKGSATVRINGKGVARAGDIAETCNDIPDPAGTGNFIPGYLPIGVVVAASTVLVGD